LSNEELLQKAVDTTDLAAGGLMNAQQYERFVNLVVAQTTMIRQARRINMRAPLMDIDKISTSGRVSTVKGEGTAPAALSEPVFSKVTLSCTELITPFEITFEALEDSIEQGNLEQTVIAAMAKQTATDIEELAINGDAAQPDPFLGALDGWRKLAQEGHMISFDGASLGKAQLSKMYKALPSQYKRDHGDLRFFFAPPVAQDWHDECADRISVSGDAALSGSVVPPYMGVPVISASMIPTDLAGIGGYAGSNLSVGFLTPASNLIFGVHRDVRVEKDKDILRGVSIYAITTRIAVTLEDADAVVMAVNVGQAA
jgi:hypothetical protein